LMGAVTEQTPVCYQRVQKIMERTPGAPPA
jgi:hypothetical protein